MENSETLHTQSTSQSLEALLFVAGGEVQKNIIKTQLSITTEALSVAVEELRARLVDSALTIIETTDSLLLGTKPKYSALLKSAYTISHTLEIGKAGLEVLAIVLYRGPSSQNDIDHIRGVSSAYTVRILATRGLITKIKKQDTKDVLYEVTTELLTHLGITHSDDIPEKEAFIEKLKAFETQNL